MFKMQNSSKAVLEGFSYSTDYLCVRKKMKVSVGYCEFCSECGVKGMAERPLKAYNYEFSQIKAGNGMRI